VDARPAARHLQDERPAEPAALQQQAPQVWPQVSPRAWVRLVRVLVLVPLCVPDVATQLAWLPVPVASQLQTTPQAVA
jgi:hypothetical protein